MLLFRTMALWAMIPALAGNAMPDGGAVVWSHDLTVAPEGAENRGGEFGVEGWTMREAKGFLRVPLPATAPEDGALIVHVRGISPEALGRLVGADRKIHFLNMFSNPLGDHHAEGGGTASDALWTLRLGTDDKGGERYPGGAKILWASRGAKRTPGSDYHEKRLPFPSGVAWAPDRWLEFRVEWSTRRKTLTVSVDGREALTVPWEHAGDPLRHVFLGGAADFAAFAGSTFRDLEVRRLPVPEAPAAVP